MITPDKIIRSARKTLSVSIDPFGKLIVRAPARLSEERIFAFLKEKENWIRTHQAKKAGAESRLPTENLDGYSFLLLGEEYKISLYGGKKVLSDDVQKRLFVPKIKSAESLKKWLKARAEEVFYEIAQRLSFEMQTSYKSLAVSSAKSRWGSCSFDNALRFSFRLLYAPVDVIAYVVAHELAHTFEKNHSPKFWAVVGAYVPDYKRKRKWLKDRAYLMEIF